MFHINASPGAEKLFVGYAYFSFSFFKDTLLKKTSLIHSTQVLSASVFYLNDYIYVCLFVSDSVNTPSNFHIQGLDVNWRQQASVVLTNSYHD